MVVFCKDDLYEKRFSYSKRKICNQNGKIAEQWNQLQAPDFIAELIAVCDPPQLHNGIATLH